MPRLGQWKAPSIWDSLGAQRLQAGGAGVLGVGTQARASHDRQVLLRHLDLRLYRKGGAEEEPRALIV